MPKDLYKSKNNRVVFFNSSSELNIDVPYVSGDGSILSL